MSKIKLTNPKVVLNSCTAPSTVGSHNTDSVVHIVLSSHSDKGGCEDSSRELGRDGHCVGEVISTTSLSRRVPLYRYTNVIVRAA